MVSYFSLLFRRAAPALAISIILSACGGGGGGGSEAAVTDPSLRAGMGSDAGSGDSGTGGGSSGGTSTATPSPAAPDAGASAKASIIDYYGDSTIWGYQSGSGARVATPAPAAFAAALPTPSRYTVRNEGVNSTDACQLLNGQDGKHPAWDTQMASSNAQVVVVNFLINDQWRMSVDQYKSCLTSLAVKAKAHGKKVIFETPNPTMNDMSTYINAMKSVAAQQGAPVIDQYKNLMAYLNGKSVYTICPDGLHPTDAIYVLKGKYAAQEYAKLGY